MNYRSCQTRIIRLFLLARRLRSKGTPLLPCRNPGTPMPLPVLPLPSLFFLSFFTPLNLSYPLSLLTLIHSLFRLFL